jgi:hypothetical protein
MQLRLHDNVQFIYELVMARMELAAAGVSYDLAEDLRLFHAEDGLDRQRLLHRSAYFKSVGDEPTDYHFIQQYNRTRSVNQYLTHWFYPYKGKFHPQMIRALLGIIGLEAGDLVLDPFIGSGTTAVEAQLLGIDCIGVDASPLCCLISRVKTGAWQALDEIEAAADYVAPCADSNAQERLFRAPDDRELPEGMVRDFFDLAEMIARSDASRRRKEALEAFVRNRDRMLASVQDHVKVREELDLHFGEADIREADARQLPLEDESVDGIITSPPYSIALNYVKNDAHALEAMGYDLDEISEEFIGVRGTGKERFELYEQDMRLAAKEMHRVLRPGAQCVVVIGNVSYQAEEVDTSGMFTAACRDAGFELERTIDKIIYGLYNVMQREYMLFFRRPHQAPHLS